MAIEEISSKDPILADIIARYHGESLSSRGDLFYTLCRSIVGQQISSKAAESIWLRIVDYLGQDPCPDSISACDFNELKSCGLSSSKTKYLFGLAEAFTGEYGVLDWFSMPEKEVRERLLELKGISPWTVDMILIFTFLKQDIFPIGDIGVVRGIEKLYNGSAEMSKQELLKQAELWRPWRTVATWYMWRYQDSEPVEY